LYALVKLDMYKN